MLGAEREQEPLQELCRPSLVASVPALCPAMCWGKREREGGHYYYHWPRLVALSYVSHVKKMRLVCVCVCLRLSLSFNDTAYSETAEAKAGGAEDNPMMRSTILKSKGRVCMFSFLF